jgi:uncharacterized protein YbjT (DUF2867 family)
MTNQDGMRVAVVGATGFVGRSIVARLAASGYRVRALSRSGARHPEWPASVEAQRADVESGAGLDDGLAGASGVVHLVAIAREGRGRSFEEVNVRGVARTLAAAERAGVSRFVHLSALGATAEPRYRYLSSKWRGEELVRHSSLGWVILRPSLLFGPGDGFFNIVKTTLTWWSPGIVAIPGDGSAEFQPLAVDDLALAVERCLADGELAGGTYELGGAERISYRQIVDRVMAVTGKRRLKLSMPVPLISAITAVTDRILPIFPVSHDQIGSLGLPNTTEPGAFRDLVGVDPRPFDLSYLQS